jgi:hypothetical protein
MDLTGYTVLVVVSIISLYDFYHLKKLKLTTSKCLTSSLITLVVNFCAIPFLSVLLSMPFENTNLKHENFLIIALILVLIFNFYRINGRKVSKGKIKREEKSGFNNIITGILILFFVSLFSSLIFLSIKYSFELWDKTMLLQELGNYGLSGSIIIIINNILVGLFYPYANKVASIGLFFLGIFALGIFCVTSYTFLQSYFLKKRKK